MAVLAQKYRFGLFLAPLCHVCDRRIHIAAHRRYPFEIQVTVFAVMEDQISVFALVVHKPRIIARPDPLAHGDKVGAVAAFVAQRPEDHARMVFIALHHSDRTLDVGVLPRRLVADPVLTLDVIAVSAVSLHKAMRLDIRLIDHIKAEFVTKLQKVRRRRIV